MSGETALNLAIASTPLPASPTTARSPKRSRWLMVARRTLSSSSTTSIVIVMKGAYRGHDVDESPV
jgi:hypothetical protein